MHEGRALVAAGIILLITVGIGWAGTSIADSNCPGQVKSDPVDMVLNKLKLRTSQLNSYQAEVEYLFSQPLFDSQSLSKGTLTYAKLGDKSRLKVDFRMRKQDDEKEKQCSEQFIFDGVWLIRIDGQTKHVEKIQLAEPNEPVDAFGLVQKAFPIVGFTRVEELKKDFEIKLLKENQSEPAVFTKLRLVAKPDSTYRDSYTSIDFWIDNKTFLPGRIVAVSTEDEVYDVKLLKAKVNQDIDARVFDYKIPQGYTSNTTPLEPRSKQDSEADAKED